MKKYIHVNRANLSRNLKGADLPAITCKTYKSNTYGNKVEIQGPSTIVYAEKCGLKPLSCGARVYIVTDSPVLIDGKEIV